MNSPYMSSEEHCIQEAIAQFYSFFGQMQTLKNDIEQLNDLDDVTRNRIMYQLDSIEREYKDSQEWFMTRDVQDVRVGVVGSEFSLKTAVVSLFVEGVLEIEGDEKDGRSKSKITVDGHCKLLLIREETGSPSTQLSQWADVLMLVFSYADIESLSQVSEFYRSFRKVRQEAPVMLVGIKDDHLPIRRYVKDESVKETIKQLDRCQSMDVTLSQQSTYLLFAQACRVALSAAQTPLSFPPNFLSPMCPLPSSMSQSSLASTASNRPRGSNSGSPFPSSPSHAQGKRGGSKRKSMFGGGKQGSYSVPKASAAAGYTNESYGSGRPVPVKEGVVNKKSQGLRAEWKKKYLVLTQDEIMYYPNFQDYMNMTHGKSFKLQQISVKMPGMRGASTHVPRVTTTPPSTSANNNYFSGSEYTDSLTVGSDHSNSQSPPPLPPHHSEANSLEVSYNSTASGFSSRIPRPDFHYESQELEQSREFRSPISPGPNSDFGSLDQFDELTAPSSFSRYEGGMANGGRGHARNGSLDDNTTTMLKQLRLGGMTYPLEEGERAATMSRIETKKMKEKKGSYISPLPASSEELLEGSQESLGKMDKKRRGDKDRYIDRSHSESAKDKSSYSEKRLVSGSSKNHKRQRSWAGNKVLEVEGGGDAPPDSCEFHVQTIENKVWTFEASSPDEAAMWVKAIELQIAQAFSESASHKGINTITEEEKREIANVEGNNFCADCNSPNPEWGSLNHGCLLCIQCSGVHRNLGSHISRIRSLTLDEWSPESRAVMLHIGNKVSRELWEAKRPRSRPIYSSSREERERFIKAKYVDKEFLADLPPNSFTIAQQLMDAVKEDDVQHTLFILAHCTPEDINQLHPPENLSPLHIACQRGLVIITQLLIWSGGDLTLLDGMRHTPQYYAKQLMLHDILSILTANGCVDDVSDASGSVDIGSVQYSAYQSQQC